MEDEKKLKKEEIKNEELTDEQLNKSAGGMIFFQYKCECGCGRTYLGRAPFYVNGKPCCVTCYTKYQNEERPQRRL